MDINEERAALDPEQKRREDLIFVCELVIVVLLALFIRQNVFMMTIVSGASMEETLHDHQIVAVDRFGYKIGSPQRGDIVICYYPNAGTKNFVKRVVGVAGDTVAIVNSVTYVNGEAVSEPYIEYPAYSDFGPYVVEEGRVFVMGDNRANSHDSRYEGALPLSLIQGRVMAVVLPFDQIHGIARIPEQNP